MTVMGSLVVRSCNVVVLFGDISCRKIMSYFSRIVFITEVLLVRSILIEQKVNWYCSTAAKHFIV